MKQLLIVLGTIIGGAIIVANFLNLWLRDSEKQKLSDLLLISWFRTAEAPPFTFIRGPIKAMRYGFDLVFGQRIFSRKAFFRISVIGTIFLLVSLAIAGVLLHNPFAGVRPWAIYGINEALATAVLHQNSGRIEQIPYQTSFCRFFTASHGITVHVLFAMLFCFVVLAINAMLNFISVALVRQVLREMEEARGFMTFVMAFSFTLFQAGISGAVAMFVILVFAFPTLWPLILATAKASSITFVIPLLVFGFGMLLVWVAGGTALRIEVVIAMLPSVAVALALSWATVAFPFKRQIHRVFTEVLLRAAESGKAAFALAAVLLGVGGLFVAFLANAL